MPVLSTMTAPVDKENDYPYISPLAYLSLVAMGTTMRAIRGAEYLSAYACREVIPLKKVASTGL